MSKHFSQRFRVKWSDVDPNMHLRANVYLDFADNVRFSYLGEMGFPPAYFQKNKMGPILFNLNASYRKEIRLNEKVEVNVKLDYLSEDGRKFGISHDVINEAGELACVVKVEGAMMDLVKRKVMVPPPDMLAAMKAMNAYEGN